MLSHATSTFASASFACSGARAPRARAGRVVASTPSRRRQLLRPRTGRLPVASCRCDASRGPDPPRAYAPAKPASDALDAPSPDPPLLIFVNGKSGGRRGEELKALLAQRPDLNALDVVDIGRRGPREALERYAGKVPDLRVLVCGGDGTVAWVLQALEDLTEVHPKPPVGIVPLGTGNDLARVFGWGARFDESLVRALPASLRSSSPAQLDRWEVTVRGGRGLAEGTLGTIGTVGTLAGARQDGDEAAEADVDEAADDADAAAAADETAAAVVFHNYLGVGVDAAAALKFHRARDRFPWLYVSAATNKLLYGVFGASDAVEHSCRDLLANHVRVIADGREISLPRCAEGVILLNINSYAGGVRMWEKGRRGRFRSWLGALISGGFGDCEVDASGEDEGSRAASALPRELGSSEKSDGLVDVVVVYGALHLGQLSWGTDRPVRVCQARNVRLVVDKSFPVHVDGQPWEQEPCTLDVSLRNTATLLQTDGGGRNDGGDEASWGLETWEDLEFGERHSVAPHAWGLE